MNKSMKLSAGEKKVGIRRKVYELENKGILCRVDIRNGVVDDYQRNKTKSHINNITTTYNERAVKLPVMSYRGGKLWMPDGQHTVAMLKAKGVGVYDVIVHFGLTKAQEAKLFVNHNEHSKRMNGWNLFKAKLIAEYEDVMDMKAMIDKRKLTTPIEVKNCIADLRTTAPLNHAYSKGTVHFKRFLRILDKSFRVDNHPDKPLQEEARSTEFQRGLNVYMIKNKKLTATNIIDRFSGYTAKDIQNKARDYSTTARADTKQMFQAMTYIANG